IWAAPIQIAWVSVVYSIYKVRGRVTTSSHTHVRVPPMRGGSARTQRLAKFLPICFVEPHAGSGGNTNSPTPSANGLIKTPQNRGEIEHSQGIGEGIDRPCEAAQQAADHDHPLRSEAIDQVPFRGYQPRLEQNEYGEGDLDRGLGPTVFGADGADEQRPAVLQVGDHHHTDEADD